MCVSVRGNRVFLPFDYVRRVVRRVKKVGRDGAKHARGSGGPSRHGGKGEEERGRDVDRERRDTHSERDRERERDPSRTCYFCIGRLNTAHAQTHVLPAPSRPPPHTQTLNTFIVPRVMYS